jgi:hypothetical protein
MGGKAEKKKKLERWAEKLKVLAIEKNFEGISPIKMALDKNQYGLIEILCKEGAVDKFEEEYEDDVVNLCIRIALSATEFEDLNTPVKLLREHFTNDMISNKAGELIESNDYRLPKLIVDKGLKMLEKNPSLKKQF